MLYNDEKNILKLIKLVPFLVIIFSIFVVLMMLRNHNLEFDKEIIQIQKESLQESKNLVKTEIQRVYKFIEDEKSQIQQNIKKEIRSNVINAHAIANSIYQNNKNKSKSEIKKLIQDALEDTRFGDHENFVIIDQNEKDKETNREFYRSKYDKNTQSEKIEFYKLFEPLKLIIGTSQYEDKYEKKLQTQIIEKLRKIRYGKNGYIFAYEYNGNTLNHINKKHLGTNRINLQDADGLFIVKEMIDISKKGDGYLTYVATYKPTTKKPERKISYIQGINDWGWFIGAGEYIQDIEGLIAQKREQKEKQNKSDIIDFITLTFYLFVFIFIVALYFSNIIKNKFTKYKNKVDELHNTLEEKVEKRTKDLNETNIKLQDTLENLSKTKKDLITSEKMASLGELVGGITHEINSPLGISITTASYLEERIKKITKQYQKDEMTQNDFETFLKNLDEFSKILNINLQNTTTLVKSFKNVAVDQAIDEIRKFNLKKYIDEILLSLKSKTKKTKLDIQVHCDETLVLHTYPGVLSQILTNFINNSILHGFKKNQKGEISIEVIDKNDDIQLTYQDNGKGINKENLENIFEQYFTTKKGSGGTGLGLYIVKDLITKKLHGTIELDKEISTGVKFIITIPKSINVNV